MSPLGFAWRSLVRQPARAALGVIGVAAVGALLFDMLLLSRGLVLSFSDLLDSTGFDVRVTSTRAVPMTGPRIDGATGTVRELAALPEVARVVAMRVSRAEAALLGGGTSGLTFMGTGSTAGNLWTLLEGQNLETGGATPGVVINRNLATAAGARPGDTLLLWGSCRADTLKLPPVTFRVSGIVEFPFQSQTEFSAATDLDGFHDACGAELRDQADVLLVASSDGTSTEAAVEAIEQVRGDLHAFSNRQLMRRFAQTDFSYFRQISFVLSAVTLLFSFLLIATLLTVSVNQRLAEVAALRALGFSRGRIVSDLVCESALLVGSGGLLALPLGGAVAVWLDGILKSMPGIPVQIHFFVLEPRAVALHVVLLAGTGFLAAAYPVWLAARLPIASTLRKEVVS